MRLLLVFATACKISAPSQEPGKYETAEGLALMQKLAPYLECLDAHSSVVFGIADGFRTASPPRHVPKLEIRACVDGIAGAPAAPSHPSLEAAGREFARALGEVAAAAPGPRLVAAFSAFDRAQAALADEVDALYRVEREARLARQEQAEGRTGAVLLEWAMFRARDLVAFAAVPLDRPDRVDVAALAARLRAYRDTVDELRASGVYDGSLLDKMSGLAIAAEQLAIRARDRVPIGDADRIMIAANNEAGVVGSPAALARAYNAAVDAYVTK